MTPASAVLAATTHATRATEPEPPAPAIVAPTADAADELARWAQEDAALTRKLVKIGGVSVAFLLVVFLTLITILGSNGQTQRSYTRAHPVAPVAQPVP